VGNVFTKFTSSTTIGNTEYDVHETPSDGTLSFGTQSAPTTYGQIGHQKGTFTSPGDAQTSQIILMNSIANSSYDDLFSNFPTNTSYIRLVGLGSLAFSAQLLVVNVNNGDTSHFEIKSTFKSYPSYSLVGSPTIITIDEDSPGAILVKVAITGAGDIKVTVGNNSGNDVQCVCYVRYTETFFYI
jgi:hypothetical protein